MQNTYNQAHVQRIQAAAAARLRQSSASPSYPSGSNNSGIHTAKRQLLGTTKPVPAPAWRSNVVNGVPGKNQSKELNDGDKEIGSKILLSKLPLDVTAQEVEELFKKTVGPLKEMVLVYNNQGKSKGMAVITFARPGDAVVAREKYNGKIVDGRRHIKIEIVYDGIPNGVVANANTTPSLLDRLGGKPANNVSFTSSATPAASTLTLAQRTRLPPASSLPSPAAAPPVMAQHAVQSRRRVRFKKGPKRLKKSYVTFEGSVPAPSSIPASAGAHIKKQPVTKDDLDKEMEDYRASAPEMSL